MGGDGHRVGDSTEWNGVVGKIMTIVANFETGEITWTDQESGQVLCKARNTDICKGVWHFFVSLPYAPTMVELVNE